MNRSTIIAVPSIKAAFRLGDSGLLEVAPFNPENGKVQDKWMIKTGKVVGITDGDMMLLFHYLELFNPLFKTYEEAVHAEASS